jgi:hypothetical protein
VKFLAQKLVITSHTTYPKIGYRGPMDFKIYQIKAFHISIFHANNIKKQTRLVYQKL